MKKLFTFISLAITFVELAQAPQGFNYQATVRNSSGALIINQNVTFKFNIMLNSQTSLPVYSETHLAPTDDLGQVNLTVGQGTPTTGTFADINWANGTYYLGIELNTGAGYVAMGTTQLLSVPYALYANNAGSATSTSSGLTHYIGELFGGGIVVSVWKTNGEEHGLIASLTDIGTSEPWTTVDFQTTLIGPTAQSARDGFSNSNAIMSQAGAGTTYAAGLCKAYNAGGFNDWYLPAINELELTYSLKNLLFYYKLIDEVNNFQWYCSSCGYWSSTEVDGVSAWVLDFYGGNKVVVNKNDGSGTGIRAVRRF